MHEFDLNASFSKNFSRISQTSKYMSEDDSPIHVLGAAGRRGLVLTGFQPFEKTFYVRNRGLAFYAGFNPLRYSF